MDKIKFQGSEWNIKTTERSRGRMKLTIKLSKEESQGFKNWASLIKPPEIAEEEFLKQIFFNGIEHLNDKLQKISMDIMNAEQANKSDGKDAEGNPISLKDYSKLDDGVNLGEQKQ